ncbi:MAG: cytidylate kinase-like family protein [Verrucomicrobiota bacterium]|nr:cytidylate kinase-like family protein [Limisphaera sp.]MDW8380505.1 cytidylate kinase-like family protein [Verrucomicrobiota bacterium]
MSKQLTLEQCMAFLNWQWDSSRRIKVASGLHSRAAITISRQTGAGGHAIAVRLAECLQALAPKDAPPWTVFDRNLIEQVLKDHHLPARLAGHLPEDAASQLEDILDDLLGLRPDSWTLVQETAETILRLAMLGHVILIGRAAAVVAARLPHVLHVRLVAPFEERVDRVRIDRKVSRKEAEELVRREDRGRARYWKRYYGADIEDPLLYHLILNTGKLSCETSVQTILQALHARPGATRA